MSSGDILLVDDDPDLLKLISLRLGSAGYRVRTADSGETALAALAVVRPGVLITDLRMPGIDGLQLFDAVHRQHPALPVIILTAHGTIPDAVSATQRGVFGFLTKPFDSQELLQLVASALKLAGDLPQASDESAAEWRAGIITRSPTMEDLLRQARRVADSDASVLIFGESGTGKELLARAIHRASPRRERAFVAVNCGAIPEPLLESELFGHMKGAFTDAHANHKGLFQAADGGTLLLDEIGDMPPALQARLLRVLAEREVLPIGATRPVAVNIRVIAATHADLEALVREGRFRDDLYYRLNGAHLPLPPLRERRDLGWMIDRLLQHDLPRGHSAPQLGAEARAWLLAHRWPGNLRELRNVLDYARSVAGPGPIELSDLPDGLRAAAPGRIVPGCLRGRCLLLRR